jgi:type IV pilus assembly protein PilO
MEQFAKLPMWGQVVVVLLLCALISIGAWFWPISGQRETLENRIKTRDDLEVQIRQGKEAQRRVDELNRQIDTIRHDLELLKSIMPMEPETGKLLRVFQGYARDQNLNILKISPSPTANKELYTEQGYGMSMTGGYHDMALFFDKIAHMRRIVNIVNLQMKGISQRNATVQADFSSMVYMQNPDAFKGLENKP